MSELLKLIEKNRSTVTKDTLLSRTERLEILKQTYLIALVEDPMDGTGFDCRIIDMINQLKETYKEE